MMRISVILLTVASALTLISSCKEEKKSRDIIVSKVVEKPEENNGPEKMETTVSKGSVKWVGDVNYSYVITRKSNPDLPKVINHGDEYYDNEITVSISRPDGTEFFNKTFTKNNFSPVIPDKYLETSVLINIRMEKSQGDNLNFIVSVGSPDDNNEEYYACRMKLNKFGKTSAEEYSVNEWHSESGSVAPDDDDTE